MAVSPARCMPKMGLSIGVFLIILGIMNGGSSSDSGTSNSSFKRSFPHSRRLDRQLPRLPRTDAVHPIYRPELVRCKYCTSYGHSLMNCRKRMDHHYEMMEKNCQKGWHKPHLHDRLDLWRCEWCLTHLHESYVKEWYPDSFKWERKRVSEQLRKNLATYTSGDSSEA